MALGSCPDGLCLAAVASPTQSRHVVFFLFPFFFFFHLGLNFFYLFLCFLSRGLLQGCSEFWINSPLYLQGLAFVLYIMTGINPQQSQQCLAEHRSGLRIKV